MHVLLAVLGTLVIVAGVLALFVAIMWLEQKLPSSVREQTKYTIKRTTPDWCKHYGHEKVFRYEQGIVCWICGQWWDFVLRERK